MQLQKRRKGKETGHGSMRKLSSCPNSRLYDSQDTMNKSAETPAYSNNSLISSMLCYY